MKMKFIVIQNDCDGRSIVLITESQKKAHKLADTLQELNDPTCENVLYEVETYVRFKGLKYWDFNGKLEKDGKE